MSTTIIKLEQYSWTSYTRIWIREHPPTSCIENELLSVALMLVIQKVTVLTFWLSKRAKSGCCSALFCCTLSNFTLLSFTLLACIVCSTLFVQMLVNYKGCEHAWPNCTDSINSAPITNRPKHCAAM